MRNFSLFNHQRLEVCLNQSEDNQESQVSVWGCKSQKKNNWPTSGTPLKLNGTLKMHIRAIHVQKHFLNPVFPNFMTVRLHVSDTIQNILCIYIVVTHFVCMCIDVCVCVRIYLLYIVATYIYISNMYMYVSVYIHIVYVLTIYIYIYIYYTVLYIYICVCVLRMYYCKNILHYVYIYSCILFYVYIYICVCVPSILYIYILLN